jgi:hypothetical protein
MTSKTSNPSGGIGFTGALQIVFIVLKLTNNISWPWIWVLAPTWISLCIVALIIVIGVICAIWLDQK